MSLPLRALVLLLLVFASRPVLATTGNDLSGRIVPDGNVADFAADEWILDAATPRPEAPQDSRWGIDNDIRRVAMTWDAAAFYLAVDGALLDAGFMVWIEYGPGGFLQLDPAGAFRRSVRLPRLAPNLMAFAEPNRTVLVGQVDANTEYQSVDSDRITAVVAPSSSNTVAVEMVVPWEMIGGVPREMRMIVAVTGRDERSGAGDAAPDPDAPLPYSRTAYATLDEVLVVRVDQDGDDQPDVGVSPRARTTVAPGGSLAPDTRPDIAVRLGAKSFAPDMGESVPFELVSDIALDVFVTSRVFAIDGRRVRTLYEDEPRSLAQGVNPTVPDDVWDGRDDNGRVVDGAVYVLAVTYGRASGAVDGVTRVSLVVIR